MKVVYQSEASPDLARKLAAYSREGIAITAVHELDREGLRRLLGDADALLHILQPIDADLIDAGPRLKLIQKIGVGVNTIDLEAAKRRGIQVANMPGTNTRAVAETAFLLMMSALRRLPALDRATRAGRGWLQEAALYDAVGELGGRTVGLVGYGAVARMLVPRLRAFGARVLYTSRVARPDAEAEWRSFDDLLAESDVVSLHLPLTEATARLMDARAFARMKPGAVLVNTARGGLVDETALVAALRDGRLRAAGLDVFAVEPVSADNPLLALDNVAVMPHVAWLTPETLDRSLDIAIENCRRVARGEDARFRVA